MSVKNKKLGFTLLEAMVVVSILAIGSTLAVGSWMKIQRDYRDTNGFRALVDVLRETRMEAVRGEFVAAKVVGRESEPSVFEHVLSERRRQQRQLQYPDTFDVPAACLPGAAESNLAVKESRRYQIFHKMGVSLSSAQTLEIISFQYCGPQCLDPEWDIVGKIDLKKHGLKIRRGTQQTLWFEKDGTLESFDAEFLVHGEKKKTSLVITGGGHVFLEHMEFLQDGENEFTVPDLPAPKSRGCRIIGRELVCPQTLGQEPAVTGNPGGGPLYEGGPRGF